MRRVTWQDKNGYLRCSLVRDSDPDEMAEKGIPVQPPDLDLIDWEAVKRDLHNHLVNAGLFTWEDVIAHQNGITNAIASVLKRRVVGLFRNR